MGSKLNRLYPSWRAYKYLIFLIIPFIFYNSLFLNKAFHIDDPFTIGIARAVNKNFINVPLEDKFTARIAEAIGEDFIDKPLVIGDNPLFMGYYYAPIIRFLGEQEVWLHLFFLPFSLLTIISMYLLSLRFTGKSILPTLFLVLTPAFLLASHNIMLDIPLLSFFLTALAAFIYGADRNNKRLLFLSIALAGIATLIKYSGFIVILLMFIYALIFSKKRYCLLLTIPLSIFFLGIIHNIIFYKHAYFLSVLSLRLKEVSFISRIPIRVFACLSFITGTSIISLFLIPHLLRNKNNMFLMLLSLPVGLCPFLIKEPFIGYSNIERFSLAFLFTSSLFIIFVIVKLGLLSLFRKSYDKETLFLSLWFLISLVFIIPVLFIAARFVLLLFPPMFLLIYKELTANKIFFTPGLNKSVLASVLITVLISTILAIGDYHFAGAYRDFVTSLKKKPQFLDKEVYFCPASYYPYLSWGYAYYLYKYYPAILDIKISEDSDKMQDLIFISPSEPVLPAVINKVCSREFRDSDYDKNLIDRFCYKSSVVLQNRRFHAGFYSHDWGLLPFYISFRQAPLETFDVYSLSIR